MSYIIKRMPCKRCYRIAIVLAFSLSTGESESNALSVDAYFFENGEKIYVFKNMRTLVHEA